MQKRSEQAVRLSEGECEAKKICCVRITSFANTGNSDRLRTRHDMFIFSCHINILSPVVRNKMFNLRRGSGCIWVNLSPLAVSYLARNEGAVKKGACNEGVR